MPAQVQKSALAAILAAPQAAAAMREAAAKEISWGPEFSRLPPGIRDGVAKLTSCKFEAIDKDYPDAGIRKGDLQYRARAVAVEPQSVVVDGEEVPVAGLQTSEFPVWIGRPGDPQAAIKRGERLVTTADAVGEVVNRMRMLGANLSANPGGAELEALAAALERAGVCFKFSTSAGKSQNGQPPRVFENWHGVRDMPADYQPPSANGQVQDGTGDRPADEAPAVGAEDEVDPDALAAEADGMDIAAALAEGGPGARLLEVAAQVGADVEACKAAATWADAAEIVKAAHQAAADAEAPEPDDQGAADEPKPLRKGDAVNHFPTVKNKAGKLEKSKKAVPCEVSAVNNKVGTCDLVQLANRKVTYKAVKVADVERV